MEAEQHATEKPTNNRTKKKKKSKYASKQMKIKTQQPKTYRTL